MACVVVLATIFGHVPAWADGAKDRPTVVIVVVGASEKLRGEIGGELPEPWALADGRAVAASAKKRKLPATVALDDPKSKGQYLPILAQVATDVGAKGGVVVQVVKGKKRHARVAMVSSAGAVVVDEQTSLATPDLDAGIIKQVFSDQLADLGSADKPVGAPPAPAASAPQAAEPSPAAPTPPAPPATADVPPTAPPSAPGAEPLPWLLATVTMELANRHLNYRDVVTSNIHSDESGIVPIPSIAVDLFPFARSGGPVFLQDLGLFGDFKRGLGSHKTLADGTKASITWTRFDLGVKYRIWVKRRWSAPLFALSLGYGQESYSFSSPAAEPLDTPSAEYNMLRPRIDMRVPAGPIAVLAGAGYLGVFDWGGFADKFREPSLYGWEADLALAVPIGKVFELQGGIAYRRFVHQFRPATGDPYIANSALDQVLRADLGLSAHL